MAAAAANGRLLLCLASFVIDLFPAILLAATACLARRGYLLIFDIPIVEKNMVWGRGLQQGSAIPTLTRYWD